MSKARQYQLRRTVRLIIDPAANASATSNGFGGTPAPMGLPRFYELDVRCSGIPDERTGYLVDIKAIDRAVRGRAADVIRSACANEPDADPIRVLRAVAGALTQDLGPPFAGVRWNLTPYHAVEMSLAMSMEKALDQQHSGASHTALLRERFDFAAAHRLHVPTLSDDENRAIFGKCNNPSGHGHNFSVSLTNGDTFSSVPDLITMKKDEEVGKERQMEGYWKEPHPSR
ncbi:MAG: hypothetical protein AAF138_08300, partial [Planctomycetota bacterium]